MAADKLVGHRDVAVVGRYRVGKAFDLADTYVSVKREIVVAVALYQGGRADVRIDDGS